MTWRALLRVIDFQRLLTSQATLAEALEESRTTSGPDSPATRNLREGFNLLAKVLFTQRATVRDVHDLAWLDHIVIAKELGHAKIWHTEHQREAFEHLAGSRGRLGELIPGRAESWVSIPLAGAGGLDALKAECGRAGPVRSGVVPHDALLELVSELRQSSARTKETAPVLEEVQRLALAGRRVGQESIALVFTSSTVASGGRD